VEEDKNNFNETLKKYLFLRGDKRIKALEEEEDNKIRNQGFWLGFIAGVVITVILIWIF